MVRDPWLRCRKLPEDCEFKTGLCHPMTGKLSVSAQQLMGTFKGKDKAVKGDGWALPFICCDQ